MPKLRERMEIREFLRRLAEARRRYGGPSRYAAPLIERQPEQSLTPEDDEQAPTPPIPCEEPQR